MCVGLESGQDAGSDLSSSDRVKNVLLFGKRSVASLRKLVEVTLEMFKHEEEFIVFPNNFLELDDVRVVQLAEGLHFAEVHALLPAVELALHLLDGDTLEKEKEEEEEEEESGWGGGGGGGRRFDAWTWTGDVGHGGGIGARRGPGVSWNGEENGDVPRSIGDW